MNEFKNTDEKLKEFLKEGIFENYALRVAQNGKELFCALAPGVNSRTLFDMASVTKILSVTTLCLMAFDEGKLSLKNKASDYFGTNEKLKDITIENLLTHTIGIGHVDICKDGVNYGNIAEHVLGLIPEKEIGKTVIYSCPAFMVLGKILEKIYGKRLDILFREKVAVPLKMKTASFLPNDRENAVNSNLDEAERGVVNDYNCKYLGGVCGNAGIFASLSDLIPFVDMLTHKGEPLISSETFNNAISDHTPDLNDSRGIGFLYVNEKYRQTGGLFGVGSFGHCGHTGQSVFVDPASGLNVILLTDATITVHKRLGHENYETVCRMREEIHRAVKTDMGS